MFLGEDLLPLLVLAMGGAMVVGYGLALVRPRPRDDDDLPQAPLARSLMMIGIGLLASVWAAVSLLGK